MKATNKSMVDIMGGKDAIWMFHIAFKDTEGENVGRTESFFMTCEDAVKIRAKLAKKYDGFGMFRIDNLYINSYEEIKRCYIDNN